MSDGRRHCYYRAVTQLNGRWYCRKCFRQRIAKPKPSPKPKKKSAVINPAGRIPDKDLLKLYRNVRRYQESGGTMDVYSSKVLINEIVPALLLEVMRLRGIELPEG